MALMPIRSLPELSITSGGLPPAKRGCSSVPICVEAATVTCGEKDWPPMILAAFSA